MRLALALCLISATAFAGKDKKSGDKAPQPPVDPTPVKPPPPPPGPDDVKATALLDKIAHGDKSAIDELTKIAPKAPDALGTFLARKHDSSLADRRKVLQAIKASVPDKSGKFNTPERHTGKEEQADDEFDWMAQLVKLDAQPGLDDVIADDAAIRALAASKDVHAAQLIFDTAFVDDAIVMRDECGRYLRKMSPYNLPALVVESESGTNYDRRRYATYQLERMDRQEPAKALDAAIADESLTVSILDAFRSVHHREAVHAVWSKVNADSPRVRAAARAAWMAYVSGPPPPPAPRRHLQLAGGKTTKYPKPLWLTYRELADNELRKAANELLHEDYPLADPSVDDSGVTGKTVEVDVEALTKRLFDFYDDARKKQEADQLAAAVKKSESGDLDGATAMLDRLLATDPDRADKASMAKIYFADARALEGKQKWQDASASYAKANGVDPKGPLANEALAGQHFALGKSLEAAGKDGGPDFRRAAALGHKEAPEGGSSTSSSESSGSASSPRPLWMLYGAGAAGLAALLMFGVAMMRRRA